MGSSKEHLHQNSWDHTAVSWPSAKIVAWGIWWGIVGDQRFKCKCIRKIFTSLGPVIRLILLPQLFLRCPLQPRAVPSSPLPIQHPALPPCQSWQTSASFVYPRPIPTPFLHIDLQGQMALSHRHVYSPSVKATKKRRQDVFYLSLTSTKLAFWVICHTPDYQVVCIGNAP
jgi:hypothetical protein